MSEDLHKCAQTTGVVSGFEARHDGRIFELSDGEAYVAGKPITDGVCVDMQGADPGRWHIAVNDIADGFLIAEGVQQEALPLWVVDWDGEQITRATDIRQRVIAYAFAQGYPAKPTIRQLMILPDGIWYAHRFVLLQRRLGDATHESYWEKTIMAGDGNSDMIFEQPKATFLNNTQTGSIDCALLIEYSHRRLTPRK